MLDTASGSYPSAVSRSDREQAIKAVRAFRGEAKHLVAALPEGDSDFLELAGALHTHLYLSLYAGAHTASAIAQSAQRHGLVCYDPQTETLTLPPSLGSGEIANPVAPHQQPMIPGEQAIVIAFGPWTLCAYVESTRRCYRKIKESGSDRCWCDNCKNFAQVRGQAYPPELLTVFDSLGVDFQKESEVHYYGRTPAGLHTYRGWFYLVGSIEHGPESWHHPPNGKPEKRFHRIGPCFEVGLGRKSGYGFSEWETVLIAAGFADGPCVEIDFYADLPWLSDAPEPGQAQ
jgi:hypothetical protein